MRTLLLISMLLFSINVLSQKIDNRENGANVFNGSPKVENKDNITGSSPETSKDYLYKSGEYLLKSAYYRYAALGSLAACAIISSMGSNADNNSTSTSNKGDAYYAISGIFLVSSLVCTIISINYKMKAGKQLKLSASGGSTSIAYTF